jgi:site-specific DNA recombinase
MRDVLVDADPADKAEVYRQLGLRLTYQPGKRAVRVETCLDPHSWGYGSCPRGDSSTVSSHPCAGCVFMRQTIAAFGE